MCILSIDNKKEKDMDALIVLSANVLYYIAKNVPILDYDNNRLICTISNFNKKKSFKN